MDGRQHTWGAVVGAALVGGAVCGTLAWHGRLGLSAACAGALIVWIACRVIDATTPPRARARPGPTAWSPYDRRRSGRAPVGMRLWRRLRPRRRAETLAPHRRATWDPRAVAPPRGPSRHPRERDAH
ncbi:MAG: hypothetical protein ACXWZS_17555 [Gemmatirosa sp.]